MVKSLQTPFPLGFNDNIYHEGNISKMPDFDVFSLLDIRRRNRRSRGKRKNGNLKRKHKNKTFWTLADLWKILKFRRHQMLSKLSSFSIASLRKLDEEANKFYDRKHDFYHTALLTRCCTQHALRHYIDSEMNHTRHFNKIPFINIGIKHVFPCINIHWVPRWVLKTAGAARSFQHRPGNPANVNARKNMFDRYYCVKVSKKSILERYFDVLFWHYFVLFFLHRRTYILVPGPSVYNYSIIAENWQEFTTWWQSLQNVVVVCHLF